MPKPKPLTIDHFLKWAPLCKLDNGRPWTIEPFWAEIIAEILNGYRELFAVLPTGSYKTTTVGGFGLYHCMYTPDGMVPIGAASKDQAAILYGQAAGFVRRTPALAQYFKVQDGYRRITCPGTGSQIRVFSADADTGDGIIPTLAVIEEYHRHKGHNLYGVWRDKLTKRDGQLWAITTAGDSEANPAEELRESARRLPHVHRERCHTVARSAGMDFVMHEYSLEPGEDPLDIDLVLEANPASQVTRDELVRRLGSPSTQRWQWDRFTCNLRSQGEVSAVAPELWDSLAEADLDVVDLDAPKFGFLDLGWKIDNTGMGVLVWEHLHRRVIVAPLALPPPVDESDVVAGILERQQTYGCDDWVYDPNAGGQQMVQQLERGQHPLQYDDDARDAKGLDRLNGRRLRVLTFIEHSQDNAPMALASSRLDEAIRNGWLVHDGNPDLRRHVLNAASKPLGGDKWKYDRPPKKLGAARKKFPIDLLTGVEMAHSVAFAECNEEPADPALYRMEFT